VHWSPAALQLCNGEIDVSPVAAEEPLTSIQKYQISTWVLDPSAKFSAVFGRLSKKCGLIFG